VRTALVVLRKDLRLELRTLETVPAMALFALFVVVSLTLTTVLFVRRPGARAMWLVAACTLLTFMTRGEWAYVPIPLFAYLMVVAARRGTFRRLLPHAVAGVLFLYGTLGLYIFVNATQNDVPGITSFSPALSPRRNGPRPLNSPPRPSSQS